MGEKEILSNKRLLNVSLTNDLVSCVFGLSTYTRSLAFVGFKYRDNFWFFNKYPSRIEVDSNILRFKSLVFSSLVKDLVHKYWECKATDDIIATVVSMPTNAPSKTIWRAAWIGNFRWTCFDEKTLFNNPLGNFFFWNCPTFCLYRVRLTKSKFESNSSQTPWSSNCKSWNTDIFLFNLKLPIVD